MIKAGDIQGTVEHVGIRSTRVRTGDGTEMIVPNGKLSDASIENRGVPISGCAELQTKVRLAYGASTREIDGFLTKLRTLLTDDPDVASEGTNVGVTDLGDMAVVIGITARLTGGSDERAVKSRLMLEILRTAEQESIGIGGAPAPMTKAAA